MIRRREFITLLGGAAAWPLAAAAQQRPLPVIGYLSGNSDEETEWVYAPFQRGIGEQGYVEGRNVEILRRNPEIAYDRLRLRELAADLVRRRVAIIFAFNSFAALAAKEATTTIPIVFAVGSDPIQTGLVAGLNRPGENVTGITDRIVEVTAKRLQLLHEIVPAAASIGYINYPSISAVDEPSIMALETAARTLGVRLVTANASTPSEIERAFAMLVGEDIGAILMGIFFWPQRDQVVALAAHYALPAMYAYREGVAAMFVGNAKELRILAIAGEFADLLGECLQLSTVGYSSVVYEGRAPRAKSGL
jgi:putative ABC transport system substrate-binding protein